MHLNASSTSFEGSWAGKRKRYPNLKKLKTCPEITARYMCIYVVKVYVLLV